jgi:hypothetical protein
VVCCAGCGASTCRGGQEGDAGTRICRVFGFVSLIHRTCVGLVLTVLLQVVPRITAIPYGPAIRASGSAIAASCRTGDGTSSSVLRL